MTTPRWKPSGARLSARLSRAVNSGPRTASDGSYSNSSKRLITGAGSTALWAINHLWTSNETTTKNGKARVKYCDHKKGGRRNHDLLVYRFTALLEILEPKQMT